MWSKLKLVKRSSSGDDECEKKVKVDSEPLVVDEGMKQRGECVEEERRQVEVVISLEEELVASEAVDVEEVDDDDDDNGDDHEEEEEEEEEGKEVVAALSVEEESSLKSVLNQSSHSALSLYGKSYSCVLCGDDLSAVNVKGRISHLKHCPQFGKLHTGFLADKHGVGPGVMGAVTDQGKNGLLRYFQVVTKDESAEEIVERRQKQWRLYVDQWWQKVKKPKRKSKQGGQGKFKQAAVVNRSSRDCPFYKRVQGTRFIVDGFGYRNGDEENKENSEAKGKSRPRTTGFFLTHFHSDHYTGLTSKFDQGTIFCTEITAKLLRHEFSLGNRAVQPLPMNERVLVDGIGVTLLDANHCPGAAILIFELEAEIKGPGKPRLSPPYHRKCIVHTGDFRYAIHMKEDPVLQQLAQNRSVDVLYLDTTYCDPSHCFPPQSVCIEFAVNQVKALLQDASQSTLFVFGSYSVGKEKIFVKVALETGLKIAVSKAHLGRLQLLQLVPADPELNHGRTFHTLFTTDPLETCLHVAPMFHVNSVTGLSKYLASSKKRYDRIVGFCPTGWSGNEPREERKEQVTLFHVPYSEHSSLPELQEFVSFLKPRQIVPTVNNINAETSRWLQQLVSMQSSK